MKRNLGKPSHLKCDGRGELLPHNNVPTALHRSVHLHLKQKNEEKTGGNMETMLAVKIAV